MNRRQRRLAGDRGHGAQPGHGTARVGLGEGIVTTRTLRRRFLGMPGRLTRAARRVMLHLPARGVFDLMAGRYQGGIPNLDVYLAGHAGDPIRVDRGGRSPESVDHPALTIGLAIQPYLLARIGRNADLAGRGLLDRFLYSIPAGMVGYRETRPRPVPEAVRHTYDTTLRALAASCQRLDPPLTLVLSPEAAERFADWREIIEPCRWHPCPAGARTHP